MSENFTGMREALSKARQHTEHELYSKLIEGISGAIGHTILLFLALRYKQQNAVVKRAILLVLNLVLVIVAYRQIYE